MIVSYVVAKLYAIYSYNYVYAVDIHSSYYSYISYVRYTHFTIIIATYIASYSFPTNYMHVLINYSTTDDAELHDDGTIVLDSEEEPLEEEDGSRELN